MSASPIATNVSSCIVHTDGACIGNPGPGGYAAVMVMGDQRRVIRGGEIATTNNRMELIAAIKAIESMKTDAAMTVVSDSQYLVLGMNVWLAGWKARGWRTSKKGPVLNRDLWERLEQLRSLRPNGIDFIWTRGHSGDAGNEEADAIANAEAAKAADRSQQQ